MAARSIHGFNFTKAFVGANGVSDSGGFTPPDTEEAYVKAAAMENAFEMCIRDRHGSLPAPYQENGREKCLSSQVLLWLRRFGGFIYRRPFLVP